MTIASKLDFFLVTLKPVTVFTARVNGSLSDPYMTIAYDAGATGTASSVGTSGAPVAGNTVWFGSTSGGQERGVVRLRSWTPGSSQISIAETDDVGPQIQDDDYITVKLEWRLWGIAPRLVQQGTEVEFYEDYDHGFTDQTVKWRPVAVAGPPAVEFYSGPTQVSFVGDRSFALAPGATISSYLWTAHGSVEGTSASQGTQASPVTFTWNAPGQYLVSLRVTDSNGNTHTSYTWAFIVNPDNISAGPGLYTQFDAYSDSLDFNQGGGECSFTVHGVADVSQFPRECLVIHAARGTQTTATGSWPFRTNVPFVGYVIGGSIRQDSVHNTTSFRAVTIDGLMKNLSMHPVSLRDETGPKDWTMAADLTVDRAASFLWHYRSTLSLMTPIRRMNYTAEIKRQDFGPTNLFDQLQNELVQDAWGQVVSDHQSVLWLVRDFNLMTTAERAAATTRKLLHKGIWLDTLDIEERPEYATPIRKVKMSGIRYPGNQAQPVPLFSEAPGDVHKAFGREDAPGRLILTTQSDLNTRCGYALARQNQRWHTVRGRFVNDGSFTIAPQEIFPANIEAADNNRGLAWTPDLIPRRIRREYDHALGVTISEVEFEPSATGPAGVTVVMPETPPANPTLPDWDLPPIPTWPPPVLPAIGAAVASDWGMGVYWSPDSGATWQRRINGLATGATGTSQLYFHDLIWDPWWFTADKKGTSDPEQVILLGCGPGFLVWSDNAGKQWQDLTVYLDDPPDIWGDLGGATKNTVIYKQIHGDIHSRDRFHVLVETTDITGLLWRGWLLSTEDFFKTSTWTALDPTGAPGGSELIVNGTFDTDLSSWTNNVLTVWEAGTARQNKSGLTTAMLDQDVSLVSGTAYDFGGTFTRAAGFNQGAQLIIRRGGVLQTQIEWTAGQSGAKSSSYTATSTDTYTVRIQSGVEASLSNGDPNGYWDNITMTGGTDASQARPLAFDLDTQTGAILYITMWVGSAVQLWVYNVSDPELPTRTRIYNGLGTATFGEIMTKTYYAVPRCLHLPGTASFGNYLYLFGRFSTGAHIYYGTDAGASFTNKSGAWTTSRVGGFHADNDGLTLYAFVNSSPAALWRSTDGGANWTQLVTDPFSVEFEAVSKHAAGDFLIGNRSAGSVQGARQAAPYSTAWTDATGPAGQRLPTAADGGGGITSIIWV